MIITKNINNQGRLFTADLLEPTIKRFQNLLFKNKKIGKF